MARSEIKLDYKKARTLAMKMAMAGMTEATEYAVGEVKVMLSKPGTGRLYRKRRASGGYIFHRASSPGQPPAVDTGALRSSIDKRIEAKGLEVYGYIGTKLEYALTLEVGGRYVAARPYLRPVLRGQARQIDEAFVKGARRAERRFR